MTGPWLQPPRLTPFLLTKRSLLNTLIRSSLETHPQPRRTLCNVRQMRKSMVLDDEKVGNMMQWTTDETVQWINSVGLGLFEQPFREHMIQGDILPFLGVNELKDMGISLARRLPRLTSAQRLACRPCSVSRKIYK